MTLQIFVPSNMNMRSHVLGCISDFFLKTNTLVFCDETVPKV